MDDSATFDRVLETMQDLPLQLMREHFEVWRAVANAINPALGVALALAALLTAREERRRGALFLGFAALSLVLVAVCAKEMQGWHWGAPGSRFPSTHMAFAVGAAFWLVVWRRRSALFLASLLAFYGWLMTALGFHNWFDVLGGVAVALVVNAASWSVWEKRDAATRENAVSTRSL